MPSVDPARSVQSPDGGDAPAAADAEPPIGLVVDVVHEAGDWDPLDAAAASVRAAADALAAELGIAASEACLALSSDAAVEALNATYRGKQGPTNVLSFPAGPAIEAGAGTQTEQPARFLGDLVLASETVAREARDLGLAFEHHLQHLVVHGLLHLLGYDHQTDADAEVMEALEVRVLARIGVADPYAAAGEPLPPGRQQTEFAK
jgi:probable rRNA maturation factor